MIGDMQQPILSVRGLTTSLARSRATILEDISFSIAPGEVVGVVGESGQRKKHAGSVHHGVAAQCGATHRRRTSCSTGTS